MSLRKPNNDSFADFFVKYNRRRDNLKKLFLYLTFFEIAMRIHYRSNCMVKKGSKQKHDLCNLIIIITNFLAVFIKH